MKVAALGAFQLVLSSCRLVLLVRVTPAVDSGRGDIDTVLLGHLWRV